MDSGSISWIDKKKKWDVVNRCIRCYGVYKEMNNIGRWECSFHAGEKMEVNKGAHFVRTSFGTACTPCYRWSCCPNVSWNPNHQQGCVPCDHSHERPDPRPYPPRIIKKTWRKELSPKDESIEEDEDDPSNLLIKRYKS